MTRHSHPTAHGSAHPPLGTTNIHPHRRYGPRHARTLRLAVAILLAWLAMGSTPLLAQRNEGEARGLVGSVAALVYNFAWPTATYEGLRFGYVQRVGRGYDVPIRLSGRSMWDGGHLWVELVLELRDGNLHDIRVGTHNAILVPPFETARALGNAIIEANEANRRSMLVGTWRDENSVYTFTADGRWWCEWDSGSTASGAWTLEGNTLTWIFDSGTEINYRLESLYHDQYRVTELRNRAVWNARRVR